MAHVEKRGPKRWRARYRDPSGKEHSKTFARKIDADNFLLKIESDKQRGLYQDPTLGKETLRSYHERWRVSAVHRLRPSTMALYDLHWRLYVDPHFGERPMMKITKPIVQEFIDEVLMSGGSIYTVETSFRLLRVLLRQAADAGLLPRSPIDGMRPPQRPRKEPKYLTPAEIAKLVDEIPERWRAFVLVAAYGGLRFGELTALRIHRVDFERRVIRVEEAIVEVAGKLREGPTKSGRPRNVALPTFVMEAIAEHVSKWPPPGGGFVFASEDGKPVRRSAWYKRVWWPALKRAGMKGTKFHALRHTSAALAIMAGAHPKAIQMRLGHHSAAFTLDVYGGLFEGLDSDLANSLDRIGRGISEENGSSDADPMAESGRTPHEP